MARPVVLSNGELHVGLNNWGMVHDFYFPYVGLENHSSGANTRHRIGVWVDGQLSWLSDEGWAISMQYPDEALIGHTVASNDGLGVTLELIDCVDSDISAFLRNIRIKNNTEQEKDVRLFMSQSFIIGDSRSNTDTAQYLPGSNAILHYRGRRAFVVSGQFDGQPFDQYTVGLFGIEGREGTHRDAEDGNLNTNNVEHGQVDSTIRFQMTINPQSSSTVNYWIAAGTSMRSALYIHNKIKDDGLKTRQSITKEWWHNWLKPAEDIIKHIDESHRQTFMQSLMIVKSQIDKRGAVIASTDSTMLKYWRDAYAYSWPRDGALVLWPLIRIGFYDEPLRFFEFSQRGLHPDGFLMHKYRADGALGSSWHPYIHEEGIIGSPIQEDETALTLFSFAQFYQKHPDQRLLDSFYVSFVQPMANFLASYIDEQTNLPLPSYNLWEEQYITSTFTTGVTYGALIAASELASSIDDEDNAIKWSSAANDIKEAAHKHLFNQERQAFYKGLLVKNGKIISKSDIIDVSSLFGAFMFGLFAVDSPEVKSMLKTIKQTFGWSLENPGLPRYEHDNYQRTSEDILGNWWPITSLWLAQYEIENGSIDNAKAILDWVKHNARSTGVMSEQINPLSGELTSVAPLTWSHAEYINTLLDTISFDPGANLQLS